jgi:hypothetical protein
LDVGINLAFFDSPFQGVRSADVSGGQHQSQTGERKPPIPKPSHPAYYTATPLRYATAFISTALGDGKGQISDFSIEKRAAQKSAQTPPPQRPTRLQRNSPRVLTEKKGVFWGCFADKRGSGLNYLTLCFAFSPVFGTLGFSKLLRLKGNRRAEASKINRA